MAEVKAQLNQLRISPRKVRTVVNLIKGKKVTDALDQLDFMPKRSAKPVKKLLSSAIANAENNMSMVKDNLFIKSVVVDEGVKLRRFKAKGFGRASPIQKKVSNIKMILDERVPGLKKQKTEAKQKEIHQHEHTHEEHQTRKTDKKPEIKTTLGAKKNVLGNIGKKLFQRKAI